MTVPPLTHKLWEASEHNPELLAPYTIPCPDTTCRCWTGSHLTAAATISLLDDFKRHDQETARLQRRRRGDPTPETTDEFISRMREKLRRADG